jgi:uncharacterized protein with GYD domain
MPKYLIRAHYSTEGTQGLLREGGTKRLEASKKTVNAMGGEIEAFYYAFGDDDLYLIMDVPDNVSMAAISLTVAATGAVRSTSTTLLSAEEMDAACKKQVEYRPPDAT